MNSLEERIKVLGDSFLSKEDSHKFNTFVNLITRYKYGCDPGDYSFQNEEYPQLLVLSLLIGDLVSKEDENYKCKIKIRRNKDLFIKFTFDDGRTIEAPRYIILDMFHMLLGYYLCEIYHNNNLSMIPSINNPSKKYSTEVYRIRPSLFSKLSDFVNDLVCNPDKIIEISELTFNKFLDIIRNGSKWEETPILDDVRDKFIPYLMTGNIRPALEKFIDKITETQIDQNHLDLLPIVILSFGPLKLTSDDYMYFHEVRNIYRISVYDINRDNLFLQRVVTNEVIDQINYEKLTEEILSYIEKVPDALPGSIFISHKMFKRESEKIGRKIATFGLNMIQAFALEYKISMSMCDHYYSETHADTYSELSIDTRFLTNLSISEKNELMNLTNEEVLTAYSDRVLLEKTMKYLAKHLLMHN